MAVGPTEDEWRPNSVNARHLHPQRRLRALTLTLAFTLAQVDACGFYFFPYGLLEELDAKFGGFFVTDLDIEWDDKSFAANAPEQSDHDGYRLVRQDTYVQQSPDFPGPFPNLKRPM